LERLGDAHQRRCVAHGAYIDLAAGQEGHSAAKIDGEPAFDAAKDGAFDALFFVVRFFQTVPSFFAAGFLAADNSFAAGVFHALKKHL